MSEPRVLNGVAGLSEIIGEELGPTEPLRVDQSMVNAFADVTRDHQFIHVDPERAEREGPFGGAVAHGFLVLSLVPPLLFGRLIKVTNTKAAINYGVNKVRFPAVTRVGADVTLRATVKSVEPKGPGHLATFALTFEATGETKPSCVAEILVMFV